MKEFIVVIFENKRWDIVEIFRYADNDIGFSKCFGMYEDSKLPTVEEVEKIIINKIRYEQNIDFIFLGYFVRNRDVLDYESYLSVIEECIEELKEIHMPSSEEMAKYYGKLTTDNLEFERFGWILKGKSRKTYFSEKEEFEKIEKEFLCEEHEAVSFQKYNSWETGIDFMILNEKVSSEIFSKLKKCGLFYHEYDAELEERFSGWCFRLGDIPGLKKKMIKEKIRY